MARKPRLLRPRARGKATISVTVKHGKEDLWSGTVQVLVYKRLIVLKCDDYWYCEWNAPTYIRPTWKTYLDYMCNTAHVKTSIEMCSYSLEPETDVTGGFVATTKGYLKTGYLEILSHGYRHDCHATKDLLRRSTTSSRVRNGSPSRSWGFPCTAGIGPEWGQSR